MSEYLINGDIMAAYANHIRRLAGTEELFNAVEIAEILAKIQGTIVNKKGKYLVQAIGYNGDVLKSDWLNTGDVFSLPSETNPPDGYVFKGWVSDAVIECNYVVVNNSNIIVYAIYDTESGATEFTTTSIGSVTLPTMTGKKSVDWGDGIVNNSNSHTYSSTGIYTIKVYGATAISTSSGLAETIKRYFTTVRISSSVTKLGSYAFSCHTSLTDIVMPNSITSIGGSAFYNCNNIIDMIAPDRANCGSGCFQGMTGLQRMYMNCCKTSDTMSSLFARSVPSSLKTVELCGAGTMITSMNSCTGVTSIVLHNGIVGAGRNAVNADSTSGVFYGCSSLTEITIPDSMLSINGKFAFSGCNNLAKVHINDIAAWCNITFGGALSNPLSYASALYLNHEPVTNLVIPDSVTSICEYAFSGYTGLTSVVIPNGVTSIGKGAFYNCSGLTSMVIPDSVTRVGNYAFYNCSGLTSIVIPDSVTSIGEYAFEGCSGLTTVVIPDSVTSIGKGAFYSNHGLTSIVIPDGVTSIGDYTFRLCDGLTSIVIPDSVTSIGEYAFECCDRLTSIYFTGTESEWNAITKDSTWDYDTGPYTLHFNYVHEE